jgi:hypothetical protein
MVVTVGAYSWSSTADRGGPLSASHACAEASITADRATAAAPSLLTDSGFAAVMARGGHTALERSLCVARQVIPCLVEVRVPEGHSW